MKSDEIISKLRAHESELRAAGVTSLAVFGRRPEASRARIPTSMS